MVSKQSAQMIKTVLFLLVTFFIAFMYTFLHESGHALVGVLSGGTITAFNINFLDIGAHVSMNSSFTPAQEIANNLAGLGLPLLVWLVFMLVVPKQANFVLESIKLVGSLVFLSTLLAWIVIPLLFWAGNAPSDDATNFLNNSGVHPFWVTNAALLLFTGGWLLFGTRSAGLRGEIQRFRQVGENVLTPAARQTLFGILSAFALCGLTAFGLNGFRLFTPARDLYLPPSDYRLLKKIDLSETAHAQTVCDFTLTKPARIGIHLLVENVQSDYFEVRLTGPALFDKVIIHAEGYTASKDSPHIEASLQPGHYACVLTNQPSSGIVSLYIKGIP